MWSHYSSISWHSSLAKAAFPKEPLYMVTVFSSVAPSSLRMSLHLVDYTIYLSRWPSCKGLTRVALGYCMGLWDILFNSCSSMKLQDVSKRVLQWYSKCSCEVSVMKTFTLKAYKLSIIQQLERWTVCKCKCFRNTRRTTTFGIPW
jgi:hypothetical protein